jgi:hypothetical protein
MSTAQAKPRQLADSSLAVPDSESTSWSSRLAISSWPTCGSERQNVDNFERAIQFR